MDAEISALEALVLLIQKYPTLSGSGIECSSLGRIEEELGMLCLTREDFTVVTELWRQEDVVPTVAQFMESLGRESALRVKAHGH